MATLNRAQMIDEVLEELGVKAAGVAANAKHASKAGRRLDTVHAQLSKRGLAPFPLTAVPEEAQDSLIAIVAAVLCRPFGVTSDRYTILQQASRDGMRELTTQYAGAVHDIPVYVEHT